MPIEHALSITLGSLCFYLGLKTGRVLLRKGATANDLFRGREWMAIGVVGGYLVLLLIAIYLPQLKNFPLQWRVYGLQGSWILIRSLFLGAIVPPHSKSPSPVNHIRSHFTGIS